tara:strand:+ start:1380 stop:1772 length:393 start_codon:yes stop_codon:yes gene_type:complete
MANPNLLSATSMYGKSTQAAGATDNPTILTCASNKFIKVTGLFLKNTGSANYWATLSMIKSGGSAIEIFSSDITYREDFAGSTPEDTQQIFIYDIFKDSTLYMEEGDVLKLDVENTDIVYTLCYEEYDDA